MNRRQFSQSGLVFLAAVGLVGCDQAAKTSSPPAPASVPALSADQIYELAATANGFSTGALMAANTAYVFFDAVCPHCAVLWENAKPLAGKLRMVWIPVAILGKASMPQGGAILAVPDPVQAMNAHEMKIIKGEKADNAAPPPAEVEKKIAANTEMLKKMGAEGVPLIIYKNAQTGKYGSQTGQMETAQLAALLGV